MIGSGEEFNIISALYMLETIIPIVPMDMATSLQLLVCFILLYSII